MQEQQNRYDDAEEMAKALKAFFLVALVAVGLLVVFYALCFGLVISAFCFGVKIGTYNWWSDAKPYHQVHYLEAQKREHLTALKGESDELQGLVDQQFEEHKQALYRPADDTHQRPHKELALEFGKAAMKHLAAYFFKRDL